ncbi:RluA family pseudouridine synthase [Leptothoe kymatousa]|uniref:RNA pseudouridylate synthase n=1 Tax=Leptothoe kymatousa TAU-MAC 1615 TaxID=2364775 RepID=A0ABS5XYN8_9CYAN|nr:RluA family pseudouridine synthase [Leptothoe kymatousa]MBT9310688.1 RluA family pseudouridine synthase [Leptothoe kymatousa TAU-MAC 1615]
MPLPPRTDEIETIARQLMQDLAADPQHAPGNVYGILLATNKHGQRELLKGFSGELKGQNHWPGWVPPLSHRAEIWLTEAYILDTLAQLKTQLIALSQRPGRTEHQQILTTYQKQLEQLKAHHQTRKTCRAITRRNYYSSLKGDALIQALLTLDQESQQDNLQYRRLKQERNQALTPLHGESLQAEQQLKALKKQYTTIAKTWQAQLQAAYGAELAGKEYALDLGASINCAAASICQRAAAKLLHYAASHSLEPVAMAEFGWTQSTGTLVQGEFYGPSAKERQWLEQLATMPTGTTAIAPTPLAVLYHDEALVVVDKPAGLLSVPGRRYRHQDSALSRLRYQLGPDFLQPVHRLDQATSGILVFALAATAHRALSQQFAQHRVHKTYEAILSQPIALDRGTIDLPLWGNPEERPKQSVNVEHGKPSVTHFQVLHPGPQPRLQFMPQTGRTHQLRVHAAHGQGLNSAIVGDGLYGPSPQAGRLHLHATALKLYHPISQEPLHLTSAVPF